VFQRHRFKIICVHLYPFMGICDIRYQTCPFLSTYNGWDWGGGGQYQTQKDSRSAGSFVKIRVNFLYRETTTD